MVQSVTPSKMMCCLDLFGSSIFARDYLNPPAEPEPESTLGFEQLAVKIVQPMSLKKDEKGSYKQLTALVNPSFCGPKLLQGFEF